MSGDKIQHSKGQCMKTFLFPNYNANKQLYSKEN